MGAGLQAAVADADAGVRGRGLGVLANGGRGGRHGAAGLQFNRHLKFKAWVKDEVKDAFRKALDRVMVKAWVRALVKAIQNVY